MSVADVPVSAGFRFDSLDSLELIQKHFNGADNQLETLRLVANGKQSLLEFEVERQRCPQSEGEITVWAGKVDRHLGGLP
jgi:hypothetical protein